MNHDPKEIWPTVENPRAWETDLKIAMRSTPPGPYVPKTDKEVADLLRIDHENSILDALFACRVMVKNVHDHAECVAKNVPGCFPNCMGEPHRTAYLQAKACLDREEELRRRRAL